MLSSLAETLMTCSLYINADVNEDSLYVLINSGFEQLQKAAYFMLSHLYQNYVPRVLFKQDLDAEIKQLQLMAEGQQAESEQTKEKKKEDKKEEEELDIFAK